MLALGIKLMFKADKTQKGKETWISVQLASTHSRDYHISPNHPDLNHFKRAQ